MPNDVDVVEFHPNRGDAESAIQTWLDNNPNVTSLDEAVPVYEKTGRVGVAMIHTD